MKYKPAHIISYSILLLAFGFLLLLLYWLIVPLKVATVKSPAQTDKMVYQNGEDIHYDLDFCLYYQSEVTLSKRFVNDGILFLPMQQIITEEPGCRENHVFGTRVPIHLNPGKYKLEITSIHHVNPIRDVVVEWETNEFLVVSKPQ